MVDARPKSRQRSFPYAINFTVNCTGRSVMTGRFGIKTCAEERRFASYSVISVLVPRSGSHPKRRLPMQSICGHSRPRHGRRRHEHGRLDPDLSRSDKPRYMALADAIRERHPRRPPSGRHAAAAAAPSGRPATDRFHDRRTGLCRGAEARASRQPCRARQFRRRWGAGAASAGAPGSQFLRPADIVVPPPTSP